MENINTILTTSQTYKRIEEIKNTMSGNTFHHHFFVLHELRTLLGDSKKTYTEIGTFNGGSLSFMLEHPFDTEYNCIDPCMYPDQERFINENIKKFNKYDRHVVLHKKFSHDSNFLNTFKKDPGSFKTDILFIDGDHSYNAVIRDFKNFEEFVNPGGFIVFDDYNDEKYSPEVKIAVDSLIPYFKEKEYVIIGDVENTQKVYPDYLERNNEYIIQKKQ